MPQRTKSMLKCWIHSLECANWVCHVRSYNKSTCLILCPLFKPHSHPYFSHTLTPHSTFLPTHLLLLRLLYFSLGKEKTTGRGTGSSWCRQSSSGRDYEITAGAECLGKRIDRSGRTRASSSPCRLHPRNARCAAPFCFCSAFQYCFTLTVLLVTTSLVKRDEEEEWRKFFFIVDSSHMWYQWEY